MKALIGGSGGSVWAGPLKEGERLRADTLTLLYCGGGESAAEDLVTQGVIPKGMEGESKRHRL